jgi:hypothetical protein
MTVLEMLRNIRRGIWSEANSTTNVDVYRRNLQRAYVDRMIYLMTEELNPQRSRQYYNVNQSDVRALVRGELNVLLNAVKSASNRGVNTETKYHYRDIAERIDAVLNPK